MQYQTLFDFGGKAFEWWPTLATTGFALVLFLYARSMHTEPTANKRIFTFSLSGVAFLFALMIFLVMRADFYRAHRELSARNFEVVEGFVEDFHPMPREGGAYESFKVRGIAFAYSDFESTPGFNHTSSHGGPIREGLPVRITYVLDSEHSPERNVILKLEVARIATK